jgi:uncharacterized surface protein with fasciclin (FAS1) repeats
MSRRTSAILIALFLQACSPAPRTIDNSQKINAGIDIVPEAVLAAQKIPPSNQPTPSDQPDLVDVISNSDQKHYTLVKLLRESGLIPMLQQAGPYTIFAPTDDAFSKLPPGVINRLTLPAHHAQLVVFLKYHLLGGAIDLTQMQRTDGQVPTLAGANVIIKGIGDKVMVNDTNVIHSDPAASNGIVHWIDGVLIPGPGVLAAMIQPGDLHIAVANDK